MLCVKCKKDVDGTSSNGALCDPCFIKVIQKRIRKEIRLNNLISKNDSVLFLDDGSASAALLNVTLPFILKSLPHKINKLQKRYSIGEKIQSEEKIILLPWNATDEADYFLDCVLTNKKSSFLGHFMINKKRYIKPLIHITKKEIEDYAKITKVSFSFNKNVSTELKKLDKIVPNVEFGLLKSIQEIKNLIKGN